MGHRVKETMSGSKQVRTKVIIRVTNEFDETIEFRQGLVSPEVAPEIDRTKNQITFESRKSPSMAMRIYPATKVTEAEPKHLKMKIPVRSLFFRQTKKSTIGLHNLK